MSGVRVADYVARSLADRGVRHVFMVTGGGAIHLNDAFGNEPGIKVVFNHHEQACAMAAEGYSRVSGRMGVVNVTTGPGGLNSLNGVFGAWTDSIPMLIISGQVKKETCLQSHPEIAGLRQLGDQEVDIVSIVKPITKYAAYVSEPESIKYHIEKAVHLAVSGRPGPCWLDIPIDVQGAVVEEEKLAGFTPEDATPVMRADEFEARCLDIADRLKNAKRPVVMLGNGVRISGTEAATRRLVEKLGLPVVTSWSGLDLMPTDHPLFCGRPGTVGGRAGNFVVQNSDVLLVLGSRLNIRQVSYNWGRFAEKAFRIFVDIDGAELGKPLSAPDMPLKCDLREFLPHMEKIVEGWDAHPFRWWLAWCKERVDRYPAVTEEMRDKNGMGRPNPYVFFEDLYAELDGGCIVVASNATPSVVGFQVARIREGLRVFANSGDASMGYDLPASIGAAFAGSGKKVICTAGEGSIQLNIQELHTIVHYRLPIKIVIIENGGYLSIKQTQQAFFKRFVGSGPESGVTFPDMVKVAKAYGFPVWEISDSNYFAVLKDFFAAEGPGVLVAHVDPCQPFEPKLSSRVLPDGRIESPSLEDMYPFLDREELEKNMLQ